MLKSLKLASLALALAGCSVGPGYVRPDMPLPAAYAQAAPTTAASATVTATTVTSATPAADLAFWRGFGDPQLSSLVEQALDANHDLRVALAHYDRVNALLRSAGFDRLPTITAGASGSDVRGSADQAPGMARGDRDRSEYSAGANVGWELDLFGRIRRNVEAQRAEAAASAADLAAAQVAIVGEVARTYIELRGLQERLRVANDNAGNQRETLRLVEARLQAGRGTEFDSARARAQLESTSGRIPALEARVAFAMHRLAVLVGRTPEALVAELQAEKPLPMLPAALDPGTPGELLRRRPDIAAAEQRLHAATARIGVATAELFPRFTLAGLIGSQALDTSALFERNSETRLLALGIDWSFLDSGRVRARIAATGADADAALARYERTVLGALEDTENALVRYAKARVEDAHLARAAIDSAQAARLARVRFDAGAADLFEVLDAERTRLQAQDAFAEGRSRSASSAVSLYVALAGGWPQSLPQRKPVSRR